MTVGRLGLLRLLRPSAWTLRLRVLVPAAMLAVAAVALSTGLSAWRLSQSLFTEQRAKGLAIATALTRHAQELLLSADASSIQELLGEYVALEGVRYVYILDAQGKVLYHSFTPSFPEGQERLNPPPAGSVAAVCLKAVVQGHHCLDVAMPILAGTLGTAHVGVDLDRTYSQILQMTFVNLLLLAVCLSLGLAWLWRQTTAALAPLDELVRAAEAVEKDGDLTWRAHDLRADETGRLAGAFQAMLVRLAELPKTLGGHTHALAEEVGILQVQHEAQGQMLAGQASALTQATVTSEEVRQISRQASGQATAMIDEAGRAVKMSERGAGALERGLESLQAVRQRVERLAADVEALESRARNIEDIVDSVKDLADQSNLLALNAAIEAMRAGEHGQGFGLVAREIRELADQSVAATQRVKGVLEDLSNGIRSAAQSSRAGALEIQGGLEKVRGTAHDVNEVQASVAASVGRLQAIATVVQQQDGALEQILGALADQGQRMRAAELQQDHTAQAVQTMRNAVKGLRILVESFQV